MYKKLLNKYGPKAVGLGLNSMALVAPDKAAAKALDIFCSPRGGKIKSYQKKFLKKFDTRELYSGSDSIMTYHYKGTGPRILLCHGWESNTFRWRKLFKHLKAANLDIVALDAPAHGASGSDKFTALRYAEMIDVVANEFEPDILCGHSVGGMASIFYLNNYTPDFVQRAIILAAPDKLESITNNYFNIIGGGSKLRTAYEQLIERTFGFPSTHFSSAKFASELDIPALIIHDEGDTINGYEEGLRIHEAWSGSQLHSTNGLDHSLQSEEVFQKVLEAIAITEL